MKFRIIAAAALLSMSGAAFAQTSAPVASPDNPVQAEMTEADRAFFEADGMDFSPLMSDADAMVMLEGEEFTTAFGGMAEADRASIIDACERAEQDRGSYGTVTTGLCDQVGAYEQ